MTYQGTVAAETRVNPLAHPHPPLPVDSDPTLGPNEAAPPRQNPYYTVPPVEGLVTLTGGELPEPTLLRPTSSKLTLRPINREEEPSDEKDRSSTLQLGQPKRNAFAEQTAKNSRSENRRPDTTQASFDRDDEILEADGAVTFSFSDSTEDAPVPRTLGSPKADDGTAIEEPAVVGRSNGKRQSASKKHQPAANGATALQPEVREASPVQLDPLTVDGDAKNLPVVVSGQSGAAGKHDGSNETAPRGPKDTAASDDKAPPPKLLRPVEPIIVADEESKPLPQKKTEDDDSADQVDEQEQTDSDAKKADRIDRQMVNGAPIVVDRGAVARIAKVSPDTADDAPVVTEGSLLVIDVPTDAASASLPKTNRPAAKTAAALSSEKASQRERGPKPQKSAQSKKDQQAKKSPEPPANPQPEIEHLPTGSGKGTSKTTSATEDFLAAHPTAGEVTVATAAVGTLSLETPVDCFAVENSSICQIMARSSTELRIIGQQEGKTRIAVWNGPRQSTEPQLYTVHVTAAGEQNRNALQIAANKLNTSLPQTFPGVDIRVTAGESKLTVHGSAQGDEQARRILRLIRQACLVPVVDEIVVR